MGTPTKRYDICAGRPYTTRSGEDKKQWIKVGKLTEWDEGGPSIELFAVPAGAWFDGKLSCFDQQDEGQQRGNGAQRQERSRPARSQQPAGDNFTDDELPPF